MGGSTRKDGPSAGGAIALALASLLSGAKIRRDVAMTGEIDTQGRITGVGGVDVKLETAFTAGCKTMIIPHENLTGEGGLARLPDALRDELHILKYEQWRYPHDRFDHARHVLQVVAVDHVVQAAEVAFVDDGELAAVESRFVAHAEEVAHALAREARRPLRVLPVIQLKASDEAGWPVAGSPFWRVVDGCTLLTTPDVREALRAEHPDLPDRVRFAELRKGANVLSPILQELATSVARDPVAPVRLALVAPFFFLKLDGILDRVRGSNGSLGDLTFFANNYTVQDVKVKHCKSLLNRTSCHLSRLEPAMLEACPFLGRRDGVWVIDLSVIPEKYRLDVRRAEIILNRCLSRWLEVVEPSGEGKTAGAS
jgi:ATP-dependent Lon protease